MKRGIAVVVAVVGAIVVGSGAQAAPANTVLGPDGLGELKLGMSVEDAYQTGLITTYQVGDPGAGFNPACGWFDFLGRPGQPHGINVLTSPSMGVAVINAHGRIQTAQGIGLGSSQKQVVSAYPEWSNEPNGRTVAVPGNARAGYTIDVYDGRVSHISMGLYGQECAE